MNVNEISLLFGMSIMWKAKILGWNTAWFTVLSPGLSMAMREGYVDFDVPAGKISRRNEEKIPLKLTIKGRRWCIYRLREVMEICEGMRSPADYMVCGKCKRIRLSTHFSYANALKCKDCKSGNKLTKVRALS